MHDEVITDFGDAEHLKPWGWNIYPVGGRDWCNWEKDGHWGLANFIRSKGISDKCVEDGGLWDIAVTLHGEEGDVEPEDQSYKGPDGRERRVSIHKRAVRELLSTETNIARLQRLNTISESTANKAVSQHLRQL